MLDIIIKAWDGFVGWLPGTSGADNAKGFIMCIVIALAAFGFTLWRASVENNKSNENKEDK